MLNLYKEFEVSYKSICFSCKWKNLSQYFHFSIILKHIILVFFQQLNFIVKYLQIL